MNTAPVPQGSEIEQRLAILEQQVAGILQKDEPKKNWESTVGTWADDELSREVDRLGQEWRASVTD